MSNSRLMVDIRAITEGALMAGATAALAIAGFYLPLLAPALMFVWALPVVIICIRHGMRAGAITMAAAGFIILILSSPFLAIDMMIRSAGPALLLGCGLHARWRSEKTLLFTSIATSVGIALSLAISAAIMGISIGDIFFVEPGVVEEMAAMFSDLGLSSSFNMSLDELSALITDTFSMMRYLIPAIMIIAGIASSVTNYWVAHFVLRKLQLPLPPMTRLADFRLPIGFAFVFVLGLGLLLFGGPVWPQMSVSASLGANILLASVALYFFQGMGFILSLIGRAPQQMRGFWKFALCLAFIIVFQYFFIVVAIFGLADALLDLRRADIGKERK